MEAIRVADAEREVVELRARLYEAEETLRAIQYHEVDALVVSVPIGERVYTLQSAEEPYRLLVEQMPEGALTLSGDGIILYSNRRFAEMVGTPHQNVVASPLISYVAPDSLAAVEGILETGRADTARGEANLMAGHGELVPIQLTISPLPEQGIGHACVVVTDLTEQRQHQRIRLLSEELEEKQTEIEELNERLQRAMTETHHRVKNNLQIIAAMVDMRLMDGEKMVPASELERIGEHTRALAAVHDILTANAKTTGEVHTISAAEVLDRLVPTLQVSAGGRPIDLAIQDVILPARQGTSLAIVLTELFSNAVKHGSGAIKIALRVEDAEAVLEVCDDGPGFPPGFDAAQTASTGLDLVQSLSSWDLAGSVSFANRAEGGACVHVTIPLKGRPGDQ